MAQLSSGIGFCFCFVFLISECTNISWIISLANVKACHCQRHNYLLLEIQKSCVFSLWGQAHFQNRDLTVSCSTHLFLQNWASKSFLWEVLPITPSVQLTEETLIYRDRECMAWDMCCAQWLGYLESLFASLPSCPLLIVMWHCRQTGFWHQWQNHANQGIFLTACVWAGKDILHTHTHKLSAINNTFTVAPNNIGTLKSHL